MSPAARRLAVALLAGTLLVSVCGMAAAAKRPGAAKAAPAPAADTSRVLVRLGDQAITVADVNRRLEEIPEAARSNFATPEGRRQLVDRIVEERVWLITAERNGVADRPAVQQQLAQQRRDLIIRTYLNGVMAANPAPSDSDARVYYDTHAADFRVPATATLRHIQSPTEARARAVLKLARGGQDWAKLAQTYSTDTLTRAQGGMLGTVGHDGMFASIGRQPALAESAFALGNGGIGGPFKTDHGWHVLKVDEIRAEGTRPFDGVRPMILRQLANQRGQEFYRQQLEDARRKLEVAPDSVAIKDFTSAKRDAREMLKTAQEIGPATERIAAYRELLQQYPDSEVSPQALFMVGFVNSEELKNYDEAEKAFRELLRRYPKSELVTSAQWMVDHMRSEEAPPFDLTGGDSLTTTPKAPAAGKESSGKP